MTLEKRIVMARLCMMHRCVLKEYSGSIESLSKRIQFNSNGTRGVGKLFLPRRQTFSKIHSLSRESTTGTACNLMLEQQSITIPLGNIYGLEWQASYCIFNVCIYYRHSLEFWIIHFYYLYVDLAIVFLCTCIVCVLQDSQVDQHFADGTFSVENKND